MTSSGVSVPIDATCSRLRIGSATTGPTPGTMSRSNPIAFSGSTMSLKKMAASTPYRRTGCSVISVTSSGRVHASSIVVPLRSSRYSGSDRPACRMNHTGVCGTGCRRQARMNAEFCGFSRSLASPDDTVRSCHGPATTAHAGITQRPVAGCRRVPARRHTPATA